MRKVYKATAWVCQIRYLRQCRREQYDDQDSDEQAQDPRLQNDVLMACFVRALAAKFHWRVKEIEKAMVTFLQGQRYVVAASFVSSCFIMAHGFWPGSPVVVLS